MGKTIRVLGQNALYDYTLLEIKSDGYTEYLVVVGYDKKNQTWILSEYFTNEIEARNFLEN